MDTPMWMVLQSGLPGMLPHDEAGVAVVVAVAVATHIAHMAMRSSRSRVTDI